MNFLINEYKKEWQFFKTNMKIMFPVMLVLMILLMVLSHYAFLTAFQEDPGLVSKTMEIMNEAFSGLDMIHDSAFMSFVKLFLNNARVCLFCIAFGMIPFLFIPVLYLIVNGGIIGMVSALGTALGTMSMSYFIAAIVPHGIFEIPAIVYSICLGLYLCICITRTIFGKAKEPLKDSVLGALRSYCLVMIPMLLVAAFVESYVTMIIASRFL
ncbi:MAG: stage II sporulation protein M [Clostridia bacterium]|nr:stage II sporulation protein M [Clostridia bacterium]